MKRPQPGEAEYHDSLRAETAHLGVRVLVVAPGSVRTSVSKNALNAQAKARGVSDDAIDNGMEPQVAARRILDAISAGQRELMVADLFMLRPTAMWLINLSQRLRGTAGRANPAE